MNEDEGEALWLAVVLFLISAVVVLGALIIWLLLVCLEAWAWIKEKLQRMKKLWWILALLLAACSSPSQKQEAAQKKVDGARSAIVATNNAVALVGAAYVKATAHALALDPEPNRFTDVAKLTLGRAEIALDSAGLIPDSAGVLALRRMVDGLIATNATLKAEATNTLLRFDKAVAAAESRESSIRSQLTGLQARLDFVNAENASLADTWTRIKSIFKWAVWIVVGVFVLRVLGGALPPPYSSPFHIVDFVAGGVGKMVMGVLPKAREAAGVVSREAHALTEDTLRRVVRSVEQFKETNPDGYKDGLKPILGRRLDQETNDAEIRRMKT